MIVIVGVIIFGIGYLIKYRIDTRVRQINRDAAINFTIAEKRGEM